MTTGHPVLLKRAKAAAQPAEEAETWLARLRLAMRDSHVSKESLAFMGAGQLLTIAIALHQQWPVGSVVLYYLAQNAVIGVFACLRLLSWKHVVADAVVSG